MRRATLSLLLAVVLALPQPALAYTNDDVIDGFEKTVFGSEYSSFFSSGAYVRKFTGRVRLHVTSYSPARRQEVERFALSLNALVAGLRVQLVQRPEQANFRVFVARSRDYERTVRQDVYGSSTAPVRGRCMVRAQFTRDGISRADAVIVGDDTRALFRRCMTEEILQGLGPLNDDPSLVHSMFNDRSRFTAFRRFDRLILNMLYDRRIRPGMTPTDVRPLLSRVLRTVRRRIEGR